MGFSFLQKTVRTLCVVCSPPPPPQLLTALQWSGRAMQNCRAALGVAEWWAACLLCLVNAPCSISRITHTQKCKSVGHFRALPPLGLWFFFGFWVKFTWWLPLLAWLWRLVLRHCRLLHDINGFRNPSAGLRMLGSAASHLGTAFPSLQPGLISSSKHLGIFP